MRIMLLIRKMRPASTPLLNSKYRPDIDGLRAVAVVAVVAFHAFPNWVRGGFIGVDVFFVISGYLISTIIFENLDRNTFSFTEFYARRIRRIFPALLLVLITCFILGWLALLPDEYKQLGKHIAGSAGFVSNLVLWNESGYFDNSAETKPLLHLWSLGIEEQFYIIWPLFLWVSWRRRFNPLVVTIIIAVSTFILNLKGVKHDMVATFYSPQSRFWELLSGSLLAWFSLYKKDALAHIKSKIDGWISRAVCGNNQESDYKALANFLSFTGMFFLLYGFWRINKELDFPGKWALLPVLGTVLIIASGSKAWVNRTILANKIAVWFGLISFPLYLWHWPLLSFARIVESEVPSLKIRIAVISLSVVLAWFTYKLVERPMRFGKHGRTRVTALIVLMAIVGYVGFNAYDRNGLAFRMKDREQFIDYFENSFPNWRYFKKINLLVEWRAECAYFNTKKYLEEGKLAGGITDSKPINELDISCYKRDSRFKNSVLVWGDSHAQSLSSGLVEFMPDNWQILQVASSICSPNPNIDSPSSESQCKQSNYFAMKTIKEVTPDVVVIAQANGHSAKVMFDISTRLKRLGVKKVLFLGPTPQWKSDLPKILARQLWLTKPKRTYIGINKDIIALNDALLKNFTPDGNAEFINVIGLFCDTNGCITYSDDDIKDSITTWDYGHLTPSASKYLSKNLLVKRIVGE